MSVSATFSFTAKRSCMYTMTSPRHQFARLNASKITHNFHRKALKVSHSFRHSSMMASTAVRTAPVSKVQHALSAIVGFFVALAIAASPAAAEETFSGIPRIVDGDTIVVAGIRVRLFGIDAPESKQSCKNTGGAQYTCGIEAAEKLKAKVADSPVRCVQQNKDQYGRSVAVCSTPQFELNEWMVKSGNAVAYKQYGGSVYAAAEDEARAAKRGIWSGEFDVPSDWRKERKIEQLEKSLGRNRTTGSTSAPEPKGFGSLNQQQKDEQKAIQKEQMEKQANMDMEQAKKKCPNILIKGNISAKGEKIYHMPGDRAYATTRIDVSDGELYFCSEAEAVAAGWRPSK